MGAVDFVIATASMAPLLAGMLALARLELPRLVPLAHVPWLGWRGGVCGAIYVTSVFQRIPTIGAAAVIGLTVVGQQVAAILFDRFRPGAVDARQVRMPRLVGVGALLLGVAQMQAA